MSSKESYKSIKQELTRTNSELATFIKDLEAIAKSSKSQPLLSLISEKKKKLKTCIPALKKEVSQLKKTLESEKEKEIKSLKKEIEQLRKTKETVQSDNYLLEYKKKDLLILADNLEDAYEEISAKNEELKKQKNQITQQADKIKKANEAILEKNTELEQQKESILDQADYLHEANETISGMHSEVQKQKDEILLKNDELVTLNNEKNNLIGIVAHDLKSPLNQIKGLISLIKLTAENLNKETVKYIDTIERSAIRLNEMIAKILDIEAIESKTLNVNLAKTDLSEILANCFKRFKLMAEAKEIPLSSDIQKGVFAQVDASFVNQIYENLISNAIKFSPKFLPIHVGLKVENNRAVCCVNDKGPGITDEDMKKLFGKYQKLSAKPTGNETSTGLGLSIVKKYVEAMDGEIWCESKKNEGASFFVSFSLSD